MTGLLVKIRNAKKKLGWGQLLLFLTVRLFNLAILFVRHPANALAILRGENSPADVDKTFGFVKMPDIPANRHLDVEQRTVNWVVPDFGIGSGGHLNIFRFVFALEHLGYRCRIYIDGKSQFSDAEKARLCIRENFVPLEAEVFLGAQAMSPAEFTFATSWPTAYTVRGFGQTRYKCYFVQDFEPFFFARGSEYVFAENTYRFGFIAITAGRWLAEKLRQDYGMSTFPLGFSYDKHLYSEQSLTGRVHGPRPRIFFYARPPTLRRAFELGILVLGEVAKRHPEAEIVMAGWDLSGYRIPFRCEDRGVMKLEDLPDLFRTCDIALVLSYSNVSLLPLELMACGCTVVSNKGEYVEWLLNDSIATLVESDVDSMANAISQLIENPDRRSRLQKAGMDFCRATDWEEEGRRFHGYLEEIRRGQELSVGLIGSLQN